MHQNCDCQNLEEKSHSATAAAALNEATNHDTMWNVTEYAAALKAYIKSLYGKFHIALFYVCSQSPPPLTHERLMHFWYILQTWDCYHTVYYIIFAA